MKIMSQALKSLAAIIAASIMLVATAIVSGALLGVLAGVGVVAYRAVTGS